MLSQEKRLGGAQKANTYKPRSNKKDHYLNAERASENNHDICTTYTGSAGKVKEKAQPIYTDRGHREINDAKWAGEMAHRKHYHTQEIAHQINQPITTTWIQTMATKTYLNPTRVDWEIHTTEQDNVQKREQFLEQQWENIRHQLEAKNRTTTAKRESN